MNYKTWRSTHKYWKFHWTTKHDFLRTNIERFSELQNKTFYAQILKGSVSYKIRRSTHKYWKFQWTTKQEVLRTNIERFSELQGKRFYAQIWIVINDLRVLWKKTDEQIKKGKSTKKCRGNRGVKPRSKFVSHLTPLKKNPNKQTRENKTKSKFSLSANHGSLQDLFGGLQLGNVVTCSPETLLKYKPLQRSL